MTLVRLAVLLLACVGCGDRVEGHYRTFAEAERAGLVSRGWLPPFVPRTATDLWEEHDLDTNELWLRFTVPPGDTSVFVGAEPIPEGDLRRVYRQPPGALRSMPREMRGHLAPDVTARHITYRRHLVPGRDAYCVALHREAHMVYVWSCPR